MILSFDELKEIITGVVRFKETDGYLHMLRFTKKQEDINTANGFGPRSFATSSMSIDFVTNSTKISFDYTVFAGGSRMFYGIDAFVNGVFVKSVFEDRIDVDGSFSLSLDGKENHIKIYLPNVSGCAIKNFSADGFVRPYKHSRKIFMIGDSITQGLDSRQPYIVYTNMLSAALDAHCLNQGVGGDVFNPELIDETIDFTPDIVTVAYGSNDWRRGYSEEIKTKPTRLFKIFNEIYPNADKFVILPIIRLDAEPEGKKNIKGDTVDDFRDRIREQAKKESFTVIEGKELVPPSPEYFSDKYLHPNDRGFQFYSERVIAEFKRLRPEYFK